MDKLKEVIKSKEFVDSFQSLVSKYCYHEFHMICWGENLTINQFLVQNRALNSVKIGVKFGEIIEFCFKKALFPYFNIDKRDDANKDITIEGKPFEIKTVSKQSIDGKYKEFQGATHSSSKCDNYILIKFDFAGDIVMVGGEDMLKELFVSISENLIKKENWVGFATGNNSRTTLRVHKDYIDAVKETIVWGHAHIPLRKNSKWVRFNTEKI